VFATQDTQITQEAVFMVVELIKFSLGLDVNALMDSTIYPETVLPVFRILTITELPVFAIMVST
jgi:hypothetical protein